MGSKVVSRSVEGGRPAVAMAVEMRVCGVPGISLPKAHTVQHNKAPVTTPQMHLGSACPLNWNCIV